ncbi:M81 family metallopeptidase [Alcaligenaceae bacterium]|nr:M81 family metallopeptidase [Alcaligenaceae bacterium]
MRIAIAGFQHETNTFSPHPTTFDDFVKGGSRPSVLRGQELLDQLDGKPFPCAGAIRCAKQYGDQLFPLIWGFATPSGAVEQSAFERFSTEIIEGLRQASPLDGIFLELHGAMVAEESLDAEGELLERIRNEFGNEIPISVSLDWHANVSERMVKHATYVTGYRSYPHIDMAATGEKAYQALRKLIQSASRPAVAFRQVPYLIPLCIQNDDRPAIHDLLSVMRAAEADYGVDVSFFPGFPASDFLDCGPSIVVYSDDTQLANTVASQLYDQVLAAEPTLQVPLLDAAAAVQYAIKASQHANEPVVIADTQDNPGAGGTSDTTGLLKELVRQNAKDAVIGLMFDPDAAKLAHQAGLGQTITLSLGGRSQAPGDSPFVADFTVEYLSDGQLECSGAFRKGLHMNLGPSCLLRIGDVRIAVSSAQSQLADLEQLRYLSVEPTKQKIIGVKSSAHFRAAFQPIASEVIICIAPGLMVTDPSTLPWKRLRPNVRLSPLGPCILNQI